MTSASVSRVTRSRRALQRALLLFVAATAIATVLRAQDQAPATTGDSPTENAPPVVSEGAPAPPVPAGDDAAADRPPVAADTPTDAPADAPAAEEAAPAPKGPSPNRFEPTEKVRADFDVSFPVDI